MAVAHVTVLQVWCTLYGITYLCSENAANTKNHKPFDGFD